MDAKTIARNEQGGDTKRKPSRRTPPQPMAAIEVPGALLKLSTLAAISGQSLSTLYRDAKGGRLKLVKRGTRCTRVAAEEAQSYLRAVSREAA